MPGVSPGYRSDAVRNCEPVDGQRTVASRSDATSRPSASTFVPSSPSASTSADATITPSAPARVMARAWAGFDTPKPTATGTGDTALTSRTSFVTVVGSDVRAPVTPTSETQ